MSTESASSIAGTVHNWINAYLLGPLHRKRYQQHLVRCHRIFDVTELITQGDFAPESERVFVQLRLSRQAPHRVQRSVIPDDERMVIPGELDRGPGVIWDYMRAEPYSNQNFAIIAGPGYGKTTLLRHIALKSVANRQQRKQVNAPRKLPLLLFLRDHATSIWANIAGPELVSEGISPNLLARLRATLLKCSQFSSDQALAPLFVDARIIPWRYVVRSAPSPADRVDALIDLLFNRYTADTHRNALVLFLQVLHDRIDAGDALHQDLSGLADELATELVYTQPAENVLRQMPVKFNSDFSLPQAMQDNITRYGGPDILLAWFAHQLKRGNCLIMLDGLDEVVDPTTRKQVAAWVKHQMTTYPKNRFILTSRPHGYLNNPLPDVMVLEVLPFSGQQVQEFVNNWYLASEFMHIREDDAEGRARAKEKANELLRRIWEIPTLYRLAANPLLLTMMVYVHRYRGTLPKRRVELYKEIYEVLLDKRPEPPGMTHVEKQRVLQPLAYAMMCGRQHEIPTGEATNIIKEPLARLSPDRASEGTFLETIENVSGLLWERERRIYSFAHLTFQEYLTAVHVQESQLEPSLVEHVTDSWWHETIRLYCAQADATSIVRACLDDERLTDTTFGLAMECLDEAPPVQPEIQAQVENVLKRCLANTELKQIVSKALADIRGKRLICVSGDQYIDPKLITHAEYQVFLEDMYAEERYYQPDHWLDWQFPEGQARMPAVGIGPADALAFCEWLNQEEGSNLWVYRLPMVEDLREEWFGMQKADDATYWIATKNGYRIQGSKGRLTTGKEVKQTIVTDTNEGYLYEVPSLFFQRPRLLPLDDVFTLIAKFDFRRVRSRILLNQVREGVMAASSETETIAPVFRQAIADCEETARQCERRCSQIDQIIDRHKAEIAQFEEERRTLHEKIRSTYGAAYAQIDEGINHCKAKITQLKDKHNEIKSKERSDIQTIDAKIEQSINNCQSQISQIEGMRCEIQAQEQSEIDHVDSQVDQAIAHYQSEIAQLEQANNTNRAEYESACSEIGRVIAQYQSEITQLQRADNEVRTEYQRIHNHYEQEIAKGEAEIAQLKRLRGKPEYDRSEIDRFIADYRSQIAQFESTNNENRSRYESTRNDLEQAISERNAEIDRLLKNKDEAKQDCDKACRHNEAEKAKANAEIARLEEDRRTHYGKIRSHYRTFYAQINQDIDQIKAEIARLEKERKTHHGKLRSYYRPFYTQIDEVINHYQAEIARLRAKRNEIKAKEKSAIKKVDSEIDQHIERHRAEIARLEEEQVEIEAQEQLAKQKASVLRNCLEGLPRSLKEALKVLQEIEGFLEDYFSSCRKGIFDSDRLITSSLSQAHQLALFAREHFHPDAKRDKFVNYLDGFVGNLKQIRDRVYDLKRIIEFSFRLESELESACKQVRDVGLDEPAGLNAVGEASRQLVRSLEAAYNFVRSRGREPENRVAPKDVYNRLHYVRLCALALASRLMLQTSQNGDPLNLVQQCLNLYIKLHLLEGRTRGVLPAFEGIRIVKERVINTGSLPQISV